LKDTSTWTVIPSSQVRVSIQNLILVGHVVEAAKLGREELWRDRGTIEAYLPRPHALLKETKSRIAEASPKPSREFYPGEKNGRFETGVGGRVIQEVCPAKKGYHIFGADQNRRRLTQVKKRNDRHRFIQSANCLLLYRAGRFCRRHFDCLRGKPRDRDKMVLRYYTIFALRYEI